MMSLQPRSAYIHVPFCRHRCGYCNFTLITGRDDLIDGYLEAFEREASSTLVRPQEMDTVFLGGGTPSYLQGSQLERLLKVIATWLPLSDGGEYSCEVNPLDCTNEQLDLLHSAGVNRISIGGQSFDNRKLAALERDHSGEQLREAIGNSSRHFTNVSLDLIFASPEESMDQWRNDIATALASPIQHLSTYGMTVERGAAFYGRLAKRQFAEVDAETQLEMYLHVIDETGKHCWEHYEVSNFSKIGSRCRHNVAYWEGSPWYAFGPGAASFTFSESGLAMRCVNHRSTTTYIRRVLNGQSAVAEREQLDRQDLLREKLVFGLRKLEGVDLQALSEWWGAPVRECFQPHLSRFLEQGLLELDGQQLRLTRRGLVISDSLWPDLLTPSE